MKNWLMLSISFGVLAGLVGAEEPDRNTKWREDLRLLAEELPKKHKDFYQTLDRDTYRRAVAELDRQIPGLAEAQVVVRRLRCPFHGRRHSNVAQGFGCGCIQPRYRGGTDEQ